MNTDSANCADSSSPTSTRSSGLQPATAPLPHDRVLAALQYCCSTEENRPALQKPFRCGGYLYATDGAVAIRVKDNPAVQLPDAHPKTPTSMESVFDKGNVVVTFSEENVAWFNESIKEVYKKSNAEEYKVNPKDRPSCKCPCCGTRLYNRGKYSWELDLVDADEADEQTQKKFALVVYYGNDGLSLINTRLNKLYKAFFNLGMPTSISFNESKIFHFAGDGWEAVCMSLPEKWYEDDHFMEVEKVSEIRVKKG